MDNKGFLAKGRDEEKCKEETAATNENESFFESDLFRLITIGLYMCGVGGLGFTLAVYYIFLWDSTMPPVPVVGRTHDS